MYATALHKNCALCQNLAEAIRPWDATWDKKCVRSICKLLEFDQNEISVLFKNLRFCQYCHQFIREVDFTMRTLAELQDKATKLKNKLEQMISLKCRFKSEAPEADEGLHLQPREETINDSYPLSISNLDPLMATETHVTKPSEAELEHILPNIVTAIDVQDEEVIVSTVIPEVVLEIRCNQFVRHESLESNETIEKPDAVPELIVPDQPEYSSPEGEATGTASFQNADPLNSYLQGLGMISILKEEDRLASESTDTKCIPSIEGTDENEDDMHVFQKPVMDNNSRKRPRFTCIRQYECEACHVRLETQTQLGVHYRKIHLKDPKPFQCGACACSNDFRSPDQLRVACTDTLNV